MVLNQYFALMSTCDFIFLLQVGSTIMPLSPEGLFPAVGMHSLGEEVRLHLHAELGNEEEDDSVMMVDSYEDEWGRLHDVKVCGTVSEHLCSEREECVGCPGWGASCAGHLQVVYFIWGGPQIKDLPREQLFFWLLIWHQSWS